MVSVLEEVSEKMKDKIQVVKIDTEKYTSIADRYQVKALPTFIIFKDGKPLDRFVRLKKHILIPIFLLAKTVIPLSHLVAATF